MRRDLLLRALAFSQVASAAIASSPESSAVLPRDAHAFALRDLALLSERELQDLTRSLVDRSFLDDIWNKLKDATTCAGGETLLVALKLLAAFGDGAFVSVIQGICKLAKVQPDDVCEGAVALEGPIIAAAIRKMSVGSRTAQGFLTTFVGVCGDPAVPEWDVPFPSTKPTTGRPKPSGKDPLKVVHYSDIHLDPLYVTGASTECGGRPICCRPYSPDLAPGNNSNPAGPNGDHMCDAPFSLEDSMYKAINQLVPDVAFTIFTGDIVDHAIWNTTQPYNTALIEHAYGKMNESLKIVYGTAGNHEAQPVNSFPANNVSQKTQWLYDLLSSQWESWVGSASVNSVESYGVYSTKFPNGNLRVISLNTNLYYRDDFWVYQDYDTQDRDGQFAWLVNELDAAEKAGERVYIIGHMPPGVPDALPDGSNYLDQIFKRYSDTIAASFYGHTHVDHFEVSYTDYASRSAENAYMMSYIAPSLTPTSGMPSFRVYDVDPETFAVLDHTTYMADMTNPSYQTTGPVWTKFYSAKEAYGPTVSPPLTDPKAELTAGFWHNVTEAFKTDQNLFNAYISRKSRGWQPATCDGDCRTNEICQLQAGRSQDNCWKPTPGIHLSRRSGVQSDHGEHDECGVPVTKKTFSAFADEKFISVLKTEIKKVMEKA